MKNEIKTKAAINLLKQYANLLKGETYSTLITHAYKACRDSSEEVDPEYMHTLALKLLCILARPDIQNLIKNIGGGDPVCEINAFIDLVHNMANFYNDINKEYFIALMEAEQLEDYRTEYSDGHLDNIIDHAKRNIEAATIKFKRA